MPHWNRLLARARALDPRVYDTLVAAGFQIAAIVEASLYAFHPADHRWLYPLGWFAAVTAVAWRRRFPLAALLTTLALADVVTALAPDPSNAFGGVVLAALMLELYNAALRTGGARLVFALVAGLAGLALNVALGPHLSSVGDVVFIAGFVLAPVAAGRALRGRRLLVAALRERADRLEAEQGERARRAAEEERARIAREIHDLVAHSVSQMTVQASAVRRVATHDPAAAAQGLAAIESEGRSTLGEMRRVLGVLRGQEEDPRLMDPQPGLSKLEALVAATRADGLAVSLTVDGERPPLAPGLDLTGFRIVEEALREARDRGGRGPLRVEVVYGAHALELAVVDESPQGLATAFLTGDADNLIRLRERVALYGGELRSGGAAEHAVRARLPLEAVRA